MNKSSFFIVGKHAVIEALKNPKRKVLKIFLSTLLIFLTFLFIYNFLFLERVKGIEPLHPAWKASVLPLNYTRTTPRVTLQYYLKNYWMVEGERFELSKTEVNGFTARPIWPLWNPSLRGSVPLFNKASNNMRFIYFICANATRDLIRKY